MAEGSLSTTSPETVAALCLSLVPGVGPRTYRQLLGAFGSAQAALDAAPSVLREIPGVGSKLARAISTARQTVDVQAELQRCQENGIRLLAIDEGVYPQRLKEIEDPPPVLYLLGSVTGDDELAIAVVGTRHATSYGRTQAERLGRELAMAGLTVVSGLARGVDVAAHRGALEGGGRTIAVLGSGLLNLYPPEHKEIAFEISERGALVSELPTLQPPKSGAFPQRNRIITGLSLGVVVVEAAQRSGALISATHAMEQGREVFAVPGRVTSRMSRGCHQLIRDGAKLVENVDDIIEELGPLATPAQQTSGQLRHPAELKLNDQERVVLNAIGDEPVDIDQVVQRSGLPVQRVLATLSVLEVRHLVRRVSGAKVVRP